MVNAHLKMALRRMVKTGLLTQRKGSGASGSFKLSDRAKKVKKVGVKRVRKVKKTGVKKARKSPKKKTAKKAKAATGGRKFPFVPGGPFKIMFIC